MLIAIVLLEVGVLVECRLRDGHQSVCLHKGARLRQTSFIAAVDTVHGLQQLAETDEVE